MENNRPKMPRIERAKQFMPFDALKGLHNALKIKEYENERVMKGGISEEKAKELSKILLDINADSVVQVKYYNDGHYVDIEGIPIVDYGAKFMVINKVKISFDDIFDITIIQNI